MSILWKVHARVYKVTSLDFWTRVPSIFYMICIALCDNYKTLFLSLETCVLQINLPLFSSIFTLQFTYKLLKNSSPWQQWIFCLYICVRSYIWYSSLNRKMMRCLYYVLHKVRNGNKGNKNIDKTIQVFNTTLRK